MHRVIYVCGAIALALIITWVCFTFAGAGRNHPKPPPVIEHVNPPVEQPLPPMREPDPPAHDPIPVLPPATVEPPQLAPPPIIVPPPVKPHARPHRKFPAKPKHVAPVQTKPVQPFCIFQDTLTGECFS